MTTGQWKNRIYYSQCWEDPYVLLDGLEVKRKDIIVSITSGGCNTLLLLLKDPSEIIALDANPAQNYLLELKISAIKYLSYEDMMAFFGVDSCSDRMRIYESLEKFLSRNAQIWWESHKDIIDKGIIHSGKLEGYFKVFRKIVLPLIHSKKTAQSVFTKRTDEQQIAFYNQTWDTWRWKLLFRIFFSKKIMSLFGRNPILFKYIRTDRVSEYYLEKTKHAICNNPWENFFLHYILIGNYNREHLPPYLIKENVSLIKERLNKVKIYSEDVETFFQRDSSHYTKYNLSNIFETLSSDSTEDLFKSIITHSRQGARLVYINHMVERSFPDNMSGQLAHDEEKENVLQNQNKAFFYKKIHIDYLK